MFHFSRCFPDRENDCKKSVKIGTVITMAKFWLLEYNDVATNTIRATSKIFLQDSELWNPHNPYNLQTWELITKKVKVSRSVFRSVCQSLRS